MAQFNMVSSKYGAQLGRPDTGASPEKKLRLFRVRLDSGGYDDGGVYWGLGKPLWCATDGADFVRFARADTRLSACVEMEIFYHDLAKPPKAGYLKLKALENSGNLGARGVILRQKLDELDFADCVK